MGLRTITKYFNIFKIGSLFISGLMEWLEEVKQEDSPGGEEITAEEYMKLGMVLANAIMGAIGIATVVNIKPVD